MVTTGHASAGSAAVGSRYGRAEDDVREHARSAAMTLRPWLVVAAIAAVALVETAGKRWM